MAYKQIKEFAALLKGDPVFTWRGPLSPLLLMFPWRKTEDDPLPSVCINKGRDSIMALDEKHYFAVGTKRFSRYWKGEISIKELQDEFDSLVARTKSLYDKIMFLPFGET